MQHPRICLIPASRSSAGQEAVDLARMAGLVLDDWQAFVLEHSLGERDDGKWSAFEVGLNVGRQNGKNAILEARELAGLFLLGEALIVHTAHEFATASESQRRLEERIDSTPELRKRVKAIKHAHGEEGIELHGGQRIRFRTRTKGGGRGFSADCVIFDEAMILPETSIGALMPTLSARPNPQVWYTGSAVDQTIHADGVVFARVRERGHAGTDPNLAYFEWSLDAGQPEPGPSGLTDALASSPDGWRQANPSLGTRINVEDISREQRTMDPRTFAVERLGVGDWPSTDPLAGSVIDIGLWRSLADDKSAMQDPVSLAYDVAPDRSHSAISAAGRRSDGRLHVEVIDHRTGTGWVAERLADLKRRHNPRAVVCDGAGPSASLVDDVTEQGVEVTQLAAADYVKACGVFFDAVAESRLHHLGSRELDAAIRGAAKRPLVDSWAWSRKSSAVDISPLVAATLAAYQADLPLPPKRVVRVIDLASV